MYEVLMPVDSSESRGAAQAETVIAMPNSESEIDVTLLYVFDDQERAESASPNQIPGGREASKRLREAGVTFGEMSRVGDPASQILSAAREVDADHIVLGGRKRSPGRSLLFGSVSQAVMLDADRPVTITGGEK